MTISCLHTTELHIEGDKRQNTQVKKNFAEASQKVIKLFVSLCRLHAEHKPITSRVKEVNQTITSTVIFSSWRAIGMVGESGCQA